MKACGIYLIMNTANGKRYYGSSLNVWARKRQHFHGLRSGTHRNKHLQAAWNLYGESSFMFSLVEEVSAENLQATEQSYLDRNHDGYNVSKCAECAPRGLKWSDESRKRFSESRRGRKLSDAHKLALSEAGKGRRMTPAQRLAASNRMKGKTHSNATKIKLSTAFRARWSDGGYRQRTVAAQRTAHSRPEVKANLSAAMTARWSDQEQREQLSAERKARWADSEYRAKMLEKRKIQGQKLRERNLKNKEKERALS